MHEIIDIAFDVTKLTAIVMLVAIVIRVFYTYKQRKKKGNDCTLESLLISNDLMERLTLTNPTSELRFWVTQKMVVSFIHIQKWLSGTWSRTMLTTKHQQNTSTTTQSEQSRTWEIKAR